MAFSRGFKRTLSERLRIDRGDRHILGETLVLGELERHAHVACHSMRGRSSLRLDANMLGALVEGEGKR